MPNRSQVLILQSDTVVAARMADLILAGTPHAEIGIVENPREALEALAQYEEIHLVLFELYFPEGSGLKFLGELRTRFRRAQMVIVTKYNLKNFSEHTQGISIFPLPLDETAFYAACHDILTTLEGTELPPFRLGKKLRSDRWGDCYEAFDTGVKREVYITLCPTWATVEQTVGFRTSAALMARASHPYVQSVYQAGEDDGRDYFAREKWDGVTLADLSTAGESILPRQAAQILLQAATILLFWQSNKYPYSPLGAGDVSISEQGLVKFANCVTPDSPITPAHLLGFAELMPLADSLRKLLPVEQTMPEGLSKLLDKILEGPAALNEVIKEAQALDVALAPGSLIAITQERREAERILALERRKRSLLAYTIIAGSVISALIILTVIFHSLTSNIKDYSHVEVEIPAGPFTFQNNPATMDKPFLIDKYEVTWSEYLKFLQAIKTAGNDQAYRHPLQTIANKNHEPRDYYPAIYNALTNGAYYKGSVLTLNSPVFNVDWYDAQAFAKWARKRLPTEQEWEKAARGPANNTFPWGTTFFPFANLGLPAPDGTPAHHRIREVEGNPQDISGYGVVDLAGNVSEWTDTLQQSEIIPGVQVAVIRGGSFISDQETDASTTSRNNKEILEFSARWLGFRCAQDE